MLGLIVVGSTLPGMLPALNAVGVIVMLPAARVTTGVTLMAAGAVRVMVLPVTSAW